jgi:hypothetical protein
MRRTTTIAAAVALLAWPAPASAADTVVATVPRATPVDVYAGHALWSTWDGTAYHLSEYADGRARELPIPQSAVPFDADAGSDAHGAPIAVYSRCRRAPLSPWALDGRRGCDLYAYRFATGREVRIARADSKADEYFPAVSHGRLAFTRTYRDGARRLYWRTLGRGGASHRLRGGPTDEDAVPFDLDMRGRTVAFVWRFEFGGQLREATTDGKGRLVLRIPGSGAAVNDITALGPSLTGGSLYWMLRVSGDEPVWSRVRRDRGRQASTRVDAAAEGYAHGGGASWYVVPAGADIYAVHRAAGLRYEVADPIVLE